MDCIARVDIVVRRIQADFNNIAYTGISTTKPKHGFEHVIETIDMYKAYWQVPIAKLSIPKTAIATPFGVFVFKAMPLTKKCRQHIPKTH